MLPPSSPSYAKSELFKVNKVNAAAVAETTPNSIAVSWKKPLVGEVTGYRVTCVQKVTEEESQDGQEVKEVKGQEVKLDKPKLTTATFTNLSADVEYTIGIYTVAEDKETKEPVVVNAKTSESDEETDIKETARTYRNLVLTCHKTFFFSLLWNLN